MDARLLTSSKECQRGVGKEGGSGWTVCCVRGVGKEGGSGWTVCCGRGGGKEGGSGWTVCCVRGVGKEGGRGGGRGEGVEGQCHNATSSKMERENVQYSEWACWHWITCYQDVVLLFSIYHLGSYQLCCILTKWKTVGFWRYIWKAHTICCCLSATFSIFLLPLLPSYSPSFLFPLPSSLSPLLPPLPSPLSSSTLSPLLTLPPPPSPPSSLSPLLPLPLPPCRQ